MAEEEYDDDKSGRDEILTASSPEHVGGNEEGRSVIKVMTRAVLDLTFTFPHFLQVSGLYVQLCRLCPLFAGSCSETEPPVPFLALSLHRGGCRRGRGRRSCGLHAVALPASAPSLWLPHSPERPRGGQIQW